MSQTKLKLRKKYQIITTQGLSTNLIANAQVLMDHCSRGSDDDQMVVGLYLPIECEPNLLPLIPKNSDVEFSVPKIADDGMEFIAYKEGDELQNNKAFPKILEPKSNKKVVPNLIFVPGIAFDIKGYRLGRGMGYYDRYLRNSPGSQAIGVTFSQKLLISLPKEDHDCRMNYIITEYMILRL